MLLLFSVRVYRVSGRDDENEERLAKAARDAFNCAGTRGTGRSDGLGSLIGPTSQRNRIRTTSASANALAPPAKTTTTTTTTTTTPSYGDRSPSVCRAAVGRSLSLPVLAKNLAFDTVVPSFTGFSLDWFFGFRVLSVLFPWFALIRSGSRWFQWEKMGCGWFYRVLPGFTGFYWVFP